MLILFVKFRLESDSVTVTQVTFPGGSENVPEHAGYLLALEQTVGISGNSNRYLEPTERY